MVKKKLSQSPGQIDYSTELLKIHPVEADNEQQAIEKVSAFYAKNKSNWKIRVIDSEALIS